MESFVLRESDQRFRLADVHGAHVVAVVQTVTAHELASSRARRVEASSDCDFTRSAQTPNRLVSRARILCGSTALDPLWRFTFNRVALRGPSLHNFVFPAAALPALAREP